MKNLIPKSFGIKLITNWISSVLMITIAVGIMFYQGTKQTVTVIVDDKENVVQTHAATVAELLDEHGIDVTTHDKVSPARNSPITENIDIVVEKAFPLTLIVGGKERQVWSTSTTVADFLVQQGVKLNQLDRVEPKLTEYVKKQNIVNVTRVEKVTDVVESPIKYNIVKKKDPTLQVGKQRILSKGKQGSISVQYEVIKENGIEIKREVISKAVLKEKQDQIVAIGKKEKGVQAINVSFSGGREIYVASTAYTASCNGCSGVTATGMNLKNNPNAKVIAVDPSIIPLGSKVYVAGYGYALAADKGGAIKGNKIDVFFPSTSEAYRWGVKRVKVRILN